MKKTRAPPAEHLRFDADGAYYEVSGWGKGSLPGAEEDTTPSAFCGKMSEACDKQVQEVGAVDVEMWKPLAVVLLQVGFLRWLSTDTAGSAKTSFASQCSFLYPLAGTVVYLALIHFGVKWMKSRPAFDIKNYLFMYNLYQCAINAYCFVSFLLETRRLGMSLWGNEVRAVRCSVVREGRED